jgi:hypothetical protein
MEKAIQSITFMSKLFPDKITYCEKTRKIRIFNGNEKLCCFPVEWVVPYMDHVDEKKDLDWSMIWECYIDCISNFPQWFVCKPCAADISSEKPFLFNFEMFYSHVLQHHSKCSDPFLCNNTYHCICIWCQRYNEKRKLEMLYNVHVPSATSAVQEKRRKMNDDSSFNHRKRKATELTRPMKKLYF